MTLYLENQKNTIADFTELALEIFGTTTKLKACVSLTCYQVIPPNLYLTLKTQFYLIATLAIMNIFGNV